MNTFTSNGLRRAGICLAMVALGASCGGESNSEKQTGGVGGAGGEGGSGGTGGGGTGGATGGTGGAGTGGATGGTGGAGTGGATGGTGGAGTGGATGGAGGAGTGGATGGSAGAGTGGTTGGTAGDAGVTGGSAGAGGATGGSAGAGGATGGSAGAGGGDAGGCPSYASFTLAIHIILDVKWEGSLATNAGTGKVHLWNRAKLNANGTMLDGLAASCGTSLPDISLNLAGQLAAGGMKVLIEIPFSAWEAPSIPTFEQKGMLAGWNPGSAVDMQPTVALVGLTMNDAATAAWPASYTMIMGADAENDGKLGITGNAKKGDPGGYVYPPTAIGLGGLAPAADKVYIASRTVLQLSGKTTTCDDQTGTATAKFFDNHVIGCHVFNGAECTPDQVKFVDDSRTVYVPTAPGTFAAKRIADNATCADVRAALP